MPKKAMNPREWSIDAVSDFLTKEGLGAHVAIFKELRVDGSLLIEIANDESILEKNMKIADSFDRKRIIAAIKKIPMPTTGDLFGVVQADPRLCSLHFEPLHSYCKDDGEVCCGTCTRLECHQGHVFVPLKVSTAIWLVSNRDLSTYESLFLIVSKISR